MTTNEKRNAEYEAPRVECMEVLVEQGFSASVKGGENESYDMEQGYWDTL
ncbi:unknown [Bacteroides sp. CAG:661]|jgi:hypothetical protein|nr:unknown [Bacteroides sp. CAG:661]